MYKKEIIETYEHQLQCENCKFSYYQDGGYTKSKCHLCGCTKFSVEREQLAKEEIYDRNGNREIIYYNYGY